MHYWILSLLSASHWYHVFFTVYFWQAWRSYSNKYEDISRPHKWGWSYWL